MILNLVKNCDLGLPYRVSRKILPPLIEFLVRFQLKGGTFFLTSLRLLIFFILIVNANV